MKGITCENEYQKENLEKIFYLLNKFMKNCQSYGSATLDIATSYMAELTMEDGVDLIEDASELINWIREVFTLVTHIPNLQE